MSSPVYPPQGPPQGPSRSRYPGPRAGTVLLWIAGVLLIGLITVIVAGSAFGLFIASHIHVEHQQHGATREVNVQSPFGSVSVKKDSVSLASLGLPVYPGAKPLAAGEASAFHNVDNDNDVVVNGEDSRNARIHLQIAGQQIDISTAEFVTDASPDVVRDFYRKQLGSLGIVEEHRKGSGEAELKVKGSEGNERSVVIRPGEGGTHFLLVHVMVGHGAV